MVGGVGADDVPPHHDRGDQTVQRRQRPPARRQEATVPDAVGDVEAVQGAERDERHHDADHHRERLEQGRRSAVTGVDRGGERQARRGGA
jgi:hypothetical protein